MVFVGSDDGNVYALNESTGALIWSYATGGGVFSSPAVTDGMVFVGSYDKNLYALNESTGALIWSYTSGDRVFSSPAVADGIVFIGSDYQVCALNESTGALIWSYTTGGSVYGSPAVADGFVFIGSYDGKVYAFGTRDRPIAIEGEWNVSLQVEVGGSFALNATFGMKNGATGGFDATAGDLLLPPGFARVESYFYYPDNPSSPVDLRKLYASYLPVEYPANWTFKVHTFTGVSGETTLSWDTSDITGISSDYQVNLGTPTGSVNMREASQYTWTTEEETTYTFTITITSEIEFTLELKAGWNMVSLPVVPDDPTANGVMPSGLFFQLVTWSGTGYVSSPEFEIGRGYWLLVLEDVNVTVSGEPVDRLNLSLSAGWSMVGGTYDEVLAADVFPGFYQLVTWTGTGYTTATLFEPGRGYWALVLANTHIELTPN